MAQLVKRLLPKHEDLSLTFSTTVKGENPPWQPYPWVLCWRGRGRRIPGAHWSVSEKPHTHTHTQKHMQLGIRTYMWTCEHHCRYTRTHT